VCTAPASKAAMRAPDTSSALSKTSAVSAARARQPSAPCRSAYCVLATACAPNLALCQ
jgi:hypothetical protein